MWRTSANPAWFMNILIVLIPISLVLLAVAAAVFVWAVRQGQFDDLETPALDILAEDREPEPRPESMVDRRPAHQPEIEPRPIAVGTAQPAQPPAPAPVSGAGSGMGGGADPS